MSRDYDAIYRRMNPRLFPYSPWEKQKELRELWPSEQAKVRKQIDAVADAMMESRNHK